MDVLSAILACSLHMDDRLVQALVQAQTGGEQFFVGNLTRVTSFESATTLDAARTALQKVQAAGARPALGLLAVPADWAEAFGKPTESLWDSCTNIQVGTAKLSEFDYECRTGKRRKAAIDSAANRACIVSRYAADLHLPARVILREVFQFLDRRPTAASE
jgi:hypothetical protein